MTSPKMLAHLLKYDTAQGSFCGKIGEGKHTVDVYKRQALELLRKSVNIEENVNGMFVNKISIRCPCNRHGICL